MQPETEQAEGVIVRRQSREKTIKKLFTVMIIEAVPVLAGDYLETIV